jgi:hypothetical protein
MDLPENQAPFSRGAPVAPPKLAIATNGGVVGEVAPTSASASLPLTPFMAALASMLDLQARVINPCLQTRSYAVSIFSGEKVDLMWFGHRHPREERAEVAVGLGELN